MCECQKRMVGYGPESWGVHHHVACPKYKTQKFPYLFYYEEAVSAWVPVPEKVENLIVVEDQLETDEKMELEFQRIDMTDEEIENLPVD